MSQQAKAYPQASCDKAEGYKEVSLGRSIREKEIYQIKRKGDTPKEHSVSTSKLGQGGGIRHKLKLYPKRKIKRKGDMPKEHSVSPSKL